MIVQAELAVVEPAVVEQAAVEQVVAAAEKVDFVKFPAGHQKSC